MKIELSLSTQQLMGRLPLYIHGRKFWLVNEKQRRDQLELKAEARNIKQNIQKLVDLNLDRRKK